MRICTPHCGLAPETTSGGETYERELLVRLGRQGVKLEIILARGKPHPEGVPGWTVHQFAIRRGLRWWVAPFVVPPAIARVHRKTGFDLLRVHSVRYIGPAALWARARYRLDVPVVAHHHHLDPSPLNRLVERRVIDACDCVITVSEFSRRQLANDLGARVDHVVVVHNGVDERFAPSRRDPSVARGLGIAEEPVAMFLGGLKRRKNLAFLLHVWREVLRRRPDATLLLAGTGPLEGRLRAVAADLGIARRVLFAGQITEAEKVDVLNCADVFVSPSSMEGFGLSVAEAMSCGLPVVVTREGALPEVVGSGLGAIVCEPGDVGAFVDAIVAFLSSPERRYRGGAANRARIDTYFRWPRAVQSVTEVYEQALARWSRDHERRSSAETFFVRTRYWEAWSRVPKRTADVPYALRAVHPSHRSVLDVPSGQGRLLHSLASSRGDLRLFAADVNLDMAREAAKSAPCRGVVVASVYALPFRDRAVDLVICHQSFMHFGDPHAAIRELARVAGRALYVSFTTRRQLNNVLRRLGLLGRSDVPHWTYDVEDVRALLPVQDFSWEILGAFLIGPKALRLSHGAYAWLHHAVGRHLPQWLMRYFGQTLFVYGTRVQG